MVILASSLSQKVKKKKKKKHWNSAAPVFALFHRDELFIGAVLDLLCSR